MVTIASSQLPAWATTIADLQRRKALRGLLVHQDSSYEHVRRVLADLGLTRASRVLVARNNEVMRRVRNALRVGAQSQLIADAETVDDALLVRTCDFERLEIPLSCISALRRLTAAERVDFELDPDGCYLCWPAQDIHVDLEGLRLAADPGLAEQTRLDSIVHDERFGRAVAEVRGRHGLTQSDILGLSERQLSRIEHGSRPRLRTLELLAAAHGQDLDAYLREVAEVLATS